MGMSVCTSMCFVTDEEFENWRYREGYVLNWTTGEVALKSDVIAEELKMYHNDYPDEWDEDDIWCDELWFHWIESDMGSWDSSLPWDYNWIEVSGGYVFTFAYYG